MGGRKGEGRRPFRTITIPEELYRSLQDFFTQNELQLRGYFGVTSISGLVSMFISEGLSKMRRRLEELKQVA